MWSSTDLLRRKSHPPPPTALAVHAQRQDFRGYCTGHIRAPIPSAPLRLHAHWLALCLTLGGQHLLLLVPVFRLLKPVVCLCTGTPTVKCLKMFLLWWQPATNSQHTGQMHSSALLFFTQGNFETEPALFPTRPCGLEWRTPLKCFPGYFLLGFPYFPLLLLQALNGLLSNTS